ncbi:MAG: glycosyltransferase [Sphingobacteriaceae bacterium]|nr:glycosyltransferase [Cytophagaceae bacterium]
MELAPLVLFCYNRPAHLRQTVESLRQNPIAADSRLYVFSDGPKTSADAPAVAEVRSFLETLSGFAQVEVEVSTENRGLAQSVIRGVTRVLKRHGKAIVLEDDLRFSPDFLQFMNAALDTYAPRSDVFSVSGYCYPIALPPDYRPDVLLLPRASSWGWGTWLDRWETVDWEMTYFQKLAEKPAARAPLLRGGADLWPMLQKQHRGLISSWAVRWSYTHAAHGAYCLHPAQSKVQNTGADGSGTHSGNTRRYDVALSEKLTHLDPTIQPDPRLETALQAYFRPSSLRRLINRFKFSS